MSLKAVGSTVYGIECLHMDVNFTKTRKGEDCLGWEIKGKFGNAYKIVLMTSWKKIRAYFGYILFFQLKSVFERYVES